MITFKNDCSLNAVKSVPDNSIDLVLTDPPYGIADKNKITKKGNKFVSTQKAWGNDFKDSWETPDEYWNFLKPFIAEISRVSKDTANIVLFLDRKYSGYIVYLIEKEFNFCFRNKLYFEKSNPVPSANKKNFLSTVEEAVWFTKTKTKDYTINFLSHNEMKQVFKGAAGGKKQKAKKTEHPCEKYEWMIKPIIERLSNEGDTVLDLFAGSGAILRVARSMNRKSIGFEKSEKFYKEAYQSLFGEEPVIQNIRKIRKVKTEKSVNEDFFVNTILSMEDQFKALKNKIIEEVLNKARNKYKDNAA